MIQSEELKSLYDLPLSLYAKEELVQAMDHTETVLARSALKQVLISDGRPVAAIGVISPSLVGRAILWFLLCDQVKPRDLRGLRTLWPKMFGYFPRVETGVEVGYIEGERFARFFGFTPFGEPYGLFGRTYQQFEARL